MTHAAQQGQRADRGRVWPDVVLTLAIIALALALRLTYDLQQRNCPLFADPRMDALYHDQWAQAIAAGETFVDGPYFRAPLYPALLGAVYRVCGHDYFAPRVVQAVLGALSCGLLFLIGRRVFGRTVGAVAGFAAASYWMLIYFDGELLIPTVIVFLDLLLLWLLLRAASVPGLIVHGVAGVVLGLSAIARPNVLLFAPAVVIWLLVLHRRRLKRAAAYVACLTAGCLLVVLPITVRNYVVGKDLVLIASQGGVNFYIGNNERSNGWTAVVPDTPSGWWEGYYATIARAEQACGRKLKASEVSDYYYDEAWGFIRSQPGQFLKLLGRKLDLFWSHVEIPNNLSIYFWTEQFTPIVRWLPLGFGVVAPLGILGLVCCWRRRAELFPLWGFVLVYMVSVVLFFCPSRYRTPVLPPLILLATWAVFGAVNAARRGRWKVVLGGAAVLAPAALLVNFTPGSGELLTPALVSYLRLGSTYAQQGKPEQAVESFRRALEAGLPGPGQQPVSTAMLGSVHYELGQALLRLGRAQEARDALAQAVNVLRAAPPTEREGAKTLNMLGQALFQLGRYDEAVLPLRKLLQAEPGSLPALDALSAAFLELGRYGEAIGCLRQEAALNEPKLAGRLVLLLAASPDDSTRDGRAAVELARRLCPQPQSCNLWHVSALAAALAETGHFEQAAELARLALARAQRSPSPTERRLVTALAVQLELYESGQPYRLPKR